MTILGVGQMLGCSKKIRTGLLVGVSVAALTVAMPEMAKPADLPAKAPVFQAAAAAPQITWWIEGGAMLTGGGEVNYFDPAFGVTRGIKPGTGWTIAGGFDYRFATSPWHVSVDFRYGRARTSSQSFSSTFAIGPFFSSSASNASHDEHHWVADFMVGRDIGLGTGSQLKLGLRVADLSATTNIAASGYRTVIGFPIFSFSSAVAQRSRFVGVGPRAAIDGAVQIQGPWSIDYNAGLALLYGNRELDVSGTTSCFGVGCLGPSSFNNSFDSKGWVPNADASLALAYAITPSFKISAGYQIDYYWGGLRTLDANQNPTNIDRSYSGPFVRLTGKF